MSNLQTRYLEKNVVKGVDNIKFEEERHYYWCYSPYYEEWVSTINGCGVAPLISTTTALKDLFPSDFEAAAERLWNNPDNRVKMETDPTYKYYGCKSIADIQAVWSQGAILGTKMHAHFEDLCNLVEYDKDHPSETNDKTMTYLYTQSELEGYQEHAYFFDFVKQFGLDDPNSGIKFYRTELLMWHDVMHFSGMIDGLLYNEKDESYIIIDWKRIKNGLQTDPKNPRKKFEDISSKYKGQLLPAFMKLRNHSGNKYGCQLTLYKHIFEHMTGKRISGMFLVVVDSTKIGTKQALKVHQVPLNKYDRCIQELFKRRAEDMLNKYHDTLDDDHMDALIEYLEIPSEISSEISSEKSENEDELNKKQKLN